MCSRCKRLHHAGSGHAHGVWEYLSVRQEEKAASETGMCCLGKHKFWSLEN